MATPSSNITGKIILSPQGFTEIKEVESVSLYQKKITDFLKAPLSDFLEIIIGGAVNLGASDIHLEPEESKTRIRIRIDGLLQEVTFLETSVYQKLLSRIKLLSGLKLNVSDRPQDGRFSIVFQNKEIEIRCSALPAEHGETLVLRLLDPSSLLIIDNLGFREDLLAIVAKQIKRPNGMVIVTGPTGSGKTTTLYAFCQAIKKPENKIITIEDPIEYRLEGISQTQVSAKKMLKIDNRDANRAYDFASGLKSVMRQDPDIILVGEMRDEETVNTALQAALTGHLVLTTLHTNDAAGVIARLLSLGGKISNIGPALNMVIGQRLVRIICPQCAKKEKITPEELEKLKKELTPLKEKIKMPDLNQELEIRRLTGCPLCNNSGYRGRLGIFEIFVVDEEAEKFITEIPPIAVLRNWLINRGMTTMKQDGFLKVLEGLTTIEEVERVAGE